MDAWCMKSLAWEISLTELQNAGSSKEVEGGTPRGGRAHCAWNAHPLNAHQDGGGGQS